MLCKLCGYEALKNVILVTNMWGEVSRDIGEAHEEELSNKFFKLALANGAQMVRHNNSTKSARQIVRRIVANRPVALRIQQELVDEQKDIVNTTAGEAINRELNGQIRRRRAESKERGNRTRNELEEERRKLREQARKIEEELEGIVANHATEDAEAKMKEMEWVAKHERERAKARHDQQFAGPSRRLRDTVNANVADRAKWEQRIKEPQDSVGTLVTMSPPLTPHVQVLCCLTIRNG